MIRWAVLATTLLAGPVQALDVTLPSTARQTVERNTAPDIYSAPVGVFENGQVPKITVEGSVARAAWRIDSPGLTPLQVMRPLREQLTSAGYDVVLDCDGRTCGGFDFRFATETLPGPNMYVNIRAYHMVTGIKGSIDAVQEVVTLLASSSAASAYVQIIHAGGAGTQGATVSTSALVPSARVPVPVGDFATQLRSNGYAVLANLDFATGSSDLGAGPFPSLNALADFLRADPAQRVALVGHTDTVGGLAPNIAISRARAQSVRQRLIADFGIAPGRLDAEGMGYLSPVTTNSDAVGRQENRRVEVVLLDRQ